MGAVFSRSQYKPAEREKAGIQIDFSFSLDSEMILKPAGLYFYTWKMFRIDQFLKGAEDTEIEVNLQR
ncbi:hypothetical protein ES705_27591 [subsurface metagenome]